MLKTGFRHFFQRRNANTFSIVGMNHLLITLFFLTCWPLMICAQNQSSEPHCVLEGYITPHSDWNQVLYVSKMNSYQDLFNGYDGLVTDSVQIAPDGYFQVLLPSDTVAPVMYRLNVAPKGSISRAGMFMWLPQENYLHVVSEAGKKLFIRADITQLTSSYALTEAGDANRAISDVHGLRRDFLAHTSNAVAEMEKRIREQPEQADRIRTEILQELAKELPAMQNSLTGWMDTTSQVYAWLLASSYYSMDNDKTVCYPQLLEKASQWAVQYPRNTFISDLLQQISEFIDFLPIGSRAPDIELSTPEGKTVRLYDVKARLILLDFWASWCSPCRVENKTYVKPLYETYRNKGFNVFGVSFDTQLKKWTDTIQKDGYNWVQVSDLLGMHASPVSTTYRVNGLPATFLLDENKVIIAKDLRGDALLEFVKKILAD
ncbi:MAG: peroxiredoxin family protein [Saprospiraceae bacterium]